MRHLLDARQLGCGPEGCTCHIAADPRVRLKLGSAIYELRATRTDDPAEIDAFLEEVKQKYDFEPEPEQREKAVLFRLEPR